MDTREKDKILGVKNWWQNIKIYKWLKDKIEEISQEVGQKIQKVVEFCKNVLEP